MPTVRPSPCVVINPGVDGEFPPLTIGAPIRPSSSDAVDALPNTPVPAGLQNLRQQAHAQRSRRTIAAASLITLGSATGVATIGFFSDTIVRVVGANAVKGATENVGTRLVGCGLGAGAAFALIAAGVAVAQTAATTQAAAQAAQPAPALELAAGTSRRPFQGPAAELHEVVIEVQRASVSAEAPAPDVEAAKHGNADSV